MHPITSMVFGALALVPVAANCAGDSTASTTTTVGGCVQLIAEGWTPAFDRWNERHGPLDYKSDGYWYAADGRRIGSALAEDAEICVFVQ